MFPRKEICLVNIQRREKLEALVANGKAVNKIKQLEKLREDVKRRVSFFVCLFLPASVQLSRCLPLLADCVISLKKIAHLGKRNPLRVREGMPTLGDSRKSLLVTSAAKQNIWGVSYI